MSFERPSLSELTRRAEAELAIAGADEALRRNLFTPLARAVAGAVHGLHGHQAWIARQLFAATCDEETLLNVHAPFWLPGSGRKPASPATGTVRLTGSPGQALASSDVLSRADGLLYAPVSGGVIDASGQLLARVVCLNAGLAGNTEPGGRLRLVNPVSGIDGEAEVQSPGLSGGADIEDIEALRDRVVSVQQTGGQVGRTTDWENWAKEVPGITRAWAAPRLLGAGSITVFVMRDNDPTPYPDTTECAAVQAHLDATGTPFGEVVAIAPLRKPVNITVRIRPDNASTRKAVTDSLTAMFARVGAPVLRDGWGRTTVPVQPVTILRSHITEALSGAIGEEDHQLTAPSADVICAIGELAELGTITWLP